MNNYILTFDVDWASDEVIEFCARILIENEIKSTWFITHDSPAVQRLIKMNSLFEIGIHPNFMSGSSHGASTKEVFTCMKNIAPKAVSMRTHGLFQSSALLKQARDEFGIQQDSSIFLPYTSGVQPHSMYYSGSAELIRIPYFWADYTETNLPKPSFDFTDSKFHVPGLKVFNFHPIHIALNTCCLKPYEDLKSKVKMSSCSMNEVQEFANTSSPGARDLFNQVIQQIKKSSPSLTLTEVAELWKKEHKI